MGLFGRVHTSTLYVALLQNGVRNVIQRRLGKHSPEARPDRVRLTAMRPEPRPRCSATPRHPASSILLALMGSSPRRQVSLRDRQPVGLRSQPGGSGNDTRHAKCVSMQERK